MPSTSGLFTECSNEEGPTCPFWKESLIVERAALHRCPLRGFCHMPAKEEVCHVATQVSREQLGLESK